MCNCGERRAALTSTGTGRRTTPRSSTSTGDDVPLVSESLNEFTLRGPASERQYQFAPATVVYVDARDVESLLATRRVRRHSQSMMR